MALSRGNIKLTETIIKAIEEELEKLKGACEKPYDGSYNAPAFAAQRIMGYAENLHKKLSEVRSASLGHGTTEVSAYTEFEEPAKFIGTLQMEDPTDTGSIS